MIRRVRREETCLRNPNIKGTSKAQVMSSPLHSPVGNSKLLLRLVQVLAGIADVQRSIKGRSVVFPPPSGTCCSRMDFSIFPNSLLLGGMLLNWAFSLKLLTQPRRPFTLSTCSSFSSSTTFCKKRQKDVQHRHTQTHRRVLSSTLQVHLIRVAS